MMKPLKVFLFLLFLSLPVVAESEALELVNQVFNKVQAHYYDSNFSQEDSDKLRLLAIEKLKNGNAEKAKDIINEMLSQLGASHTRLFSSHEPDYYELLELFSHGPQREEILKLFRGKSPSYVGIAASFRETEVLGVLPGGPADLAGLQVGDRILEVNGRPFQAIESFHGHAGDPLEVKVQRGKSMTRLQVTARHIDPRLEFLDSIERSARVIELGPYSVAYVRVWSYAGEAYHQELIRVLEGDLADADALVLDLRGRWGGAQPTFMSSFHSVPGLTMNARDAEPFIFNEPGWNKPITVVIDESVTSGKELLAHAFARSGRGWLVGRNTAGAVLGGSLHLIGEEHALYLAQADVTVDGVRLEGIGVTPDVEFQAEAKDYRDLACFEAATRLMARELRERGVQDQMSRRTKPVNWSRIESIDKENTAYLKRLVEAFGWPKQRDVGARAARNAWLIVQHSSDLGFQERCLELMRPLVTQGEVREVDVAYLEDRINLYRGRPQRYGTQLQRVDGRLEFWKFDDRSKVEERRRKLGLPSLDEYLETVRGTL